MRKVIFFLSLCFTLKAFGQQPKMELYDIIKMFLYDSTGYENVGDWSVGQEGKLKLNWKSDRLEMSDDTSINFYRKGTADVTIKGREMTIGGKAARWNVLLKGPRMGYTSFSIISPASTQVRPRTTIDSLFGRRAYQARLIKSCDTKPLLGYYYYELRLPRKDLAYIKVSWLTMNGATALRIDGYDRYSQYAVKFDCR